VICGKEVTYVKELDAKIALANIGGKRSSKREECRYYYCTQHKGYHLTSRKA